MMGLGQLLMLVVFLSIPFRYQALWFAFVFRHSAMLAGLAVLLSVVSILVIIMLDKINMPTRVRYHEPRPNPARVAKILALIEPRRRRCITYYETEELPLAVGCSKAGGKPDLPAGQHPPLDEDGHPLELVLQVRCSDLASLDSEGHYPHSGMLYFFDRLVLYRPQDEELHSTCEGDDDNGTSVVFDEGWDFPDFFDLEKQIPKSTWEDYREARLKAGCPDRHGNFGGYYHPNIEGEAYDEELRGRCEVLLNVETREWDCGNYLIEPQHLADRYFGETYIEWA